MPTDDIRIGLISDCEGSLAPLQAALTAMKNEACDVIVYAGDILACPFSPDPPSQTIRLLRSEAVLAIPGNNDRYLMDWGTARWPHTLWMRLRRSDPIGDWLTDVSRGQAQIDPNDLSWLRGLPEEFLVTDGVYVCHGMPGNPWNTIWPRSPEYDGNVSDLDRQASLEMLAEVDARIVLCGHIAEPKDCQDTLPDGRAFRVIRAGPRHETGVGYALLTRRNNLWTVEWSNAAIDG